MATNGVRQCTIERTEDVMNTKRNRISVERDMKNHSSVTTIKNQTLLPNTCYPNLHHIMFIHHCEKLKQKTQWMVHAGKTELQVHIMF